jgi:N-acetyl-alpha-D-glucosaminyl L-malate synthase BshA
MKIGIVCYPTFGGSGVVATELGISLSHLGHEIHFITYKQPVRLSGLNQKVHFHEVFVPKYPLFHYQPYELALSSKLVDMVKLHDIELLHVHYAIPHAYAAYMAKQMLASENIHIPIVTTLHGTDITLVGNHPFYKPAVEFSINHSDAVTCVSQSLKEDTHELFSINKNIQVIPNFIDVNNHRSQFSDCDRGSIALESERIIAHVSNFRPVKRVGDVIQIFYRIQQSLSAKLMMIGDGPDRAFAEDLCQKLGITDQVIFFGNSNEVNRVLCFSDLFLLPSETESFGLAALEAMLSETPVIASDQGGIPEVVEHVFSGFLAPVGDVDTMSQDALKILSDDTVLKQFKANALKAAQKFDIDRVVPFYEEAYKNAIQQISQSGR